MEAKFQKKKTSPVSCREKIEGKNRIFRNSFDQTNIYTNVYIYIPMDNSVTIPFASLIRGNEWTINNILKKKTLALNGSYLMCTPASKEIHTRHVDRCTYTPHTHVHHSSVW